MSAESTTRTLWRHSVAHAAPRRVTTQPAIAASASTSITELLSGALGSAPALLRAAYFVARFFEPKAQLQDACACCSGRACQTPPMAAWKRAGAA